MFDCTIRNPECNKIVLHKIHKTGSGTLLTILFLQSLFNGLHVNPDDAVEVLSGQYNVYLSHFPGGWRPETQSWPNVKAYYAARVAPPYTFVVPVREPLRRFMSHCRYFMGKQLKKDREGTLKKMTHVTQNYMLQYMGLFNETAYRNFIRSDDFWRPLYLPAERFDESLMLLARTCDIHPYCLAHMKTHARKQRPPPGMPPKFAEKSRSKKTKGSKHRGLLAAPLSDNGSTKSDRVVPLSSSDGPSRRLQGGLFSWLGQVFGGGGGGAGGAESDSMDPAAMESLLADLRSIGRDPIRSYTLPMGRMPLNESTVDSAAEALDLRPEFVRQFRELHRFDYDFYERTFKVFERKLAVYKSDPTFAQDLACLQDMSECIHGTCMAGMGVQKASRTLCQFFRSGDTARLQMLNDQGIWEGPPDIVHSFNKTYNKCLKRMDSCSRFVSRPSGDSHGGGGEQEKGKKGRGLLEWEARSDGAGSSAVGSRLDAAAGRAGDSDAVGLQPRRPGSGFESEGDRRRRRDRGARGRSQLQPRDGVGGTDGEG